jgi:hypothetical protein
MNLLHKTDEYISRRITWKAAQHALPSDFSFFYTTLPIEVKEYLSTQIVTDHAEIPVIFFTKPSQEWTLLSTRQLYGRNSNGDIYGIKLADIKHFTSKKFVSEKEKFSTSLKKNEWHELLITDKNGQVITFHAHKGSDLFALWNILLMAVRFYRA